MRMVLEGEQRIRVEMRRDGFEIEAGQVPISPYHLLAGSLASCIGLLAGPWAENVRADLNDLIIHVDWEHAEDGCVSRMEVALDWSGLPESRLRTVERIAAACPVHETLVRGTEISTRASAA